VSELTGNSHPIGVFFLTTYLPSSDATAPGPGSIVPNPFKITEGPRHHQQQQAEVQGEALPLLHQQPCSNVDGPINLHRRHVVVLAPLAAASAALASASDAQAEEEVPASSEPGCRECMGMGVVPCELKDGFVVHICTYT